MSDPRGHEGHDLEPLDTVWRCCTCYVDIPRKAPAPEEPAPLALDAESDGTGLSVDVAVTVRW